jgi:hypothetical protein
MQARHYNSNGHRNQTNSPQPLHITKSQSTRSPPLPLPSQNFRSDYRINQQTRYQPLQLERHQSHNKPDLCVIIITFVTIITRADVSISSN